MRRWVPVLMAVLLGMAGPFAGAAGAGAGAAASPAGPCGTAPAERAVTHVVWIWMENHSRSSVIGSPAAPYQNQLARSCAQATDDSAITHPSLPNYLAATSGSTQGVRDDADPQAHPLGGPSLFSQVQDAGLTWRSYEEAMPGRCALTSRVPYAVKHNPAAYFTRQRQACQRWDVALEDPAAGLAHDLGSGLPAFAFVTPDLCHDAHDCPLGSGDAWLRRWVPRITNTAAYRAGHVLVVITYDEGVGADQRVPLLALAAVLTPGRRVSSPQSHYSLLGVTEEVLGLGLLGEASRAPSLRAALGLAAHVRGAARPRAV
jgi:hypothetical protein